jgi:crotonobetainyl-CoA:carnitine CoA-transferase CaiB-like acyl-CoA transferase
MNPQASGPLTGIRVIDLTTVLMGPYATQILGDMGADVIKVETPSGDSLRYAGPARHRGMGPIFLHVNRNKRSITLDLKTKEGREAMLKLCESADVLAYNVRPQAMNRLGLGYEDVCKRNPKIVYAGMFGFGRNGPYANNPAYDDLIQGLSAYPATYARATGNAPSFVPANICDRTVGLYAVGAITAALFHAARSSIGQMVDIPMFETMAQFMLGDNLYGETFIPASGPTGYARLMAPERKPFATKDGYLCVLPYTDKHWIDFFELAGLCGATKEDPRFSTMAGRTDNINELYRLVSDALKGGTTNEWFEKLGQADIPVAPMHTIESLLTDPHLKACDFFQVQEHPTEGNIRIMDVPAKWSATPSSIRLPAPRLGEHSEQILSEIGYRTEQIADMLQSGATKRCAA